jgi:hypothetical protein
MHPPAANSQQGIAINSSHSAAKGMTTKLRMP